MKPRIVVKTTETGCHYAAKVAGPYHLEKELERGPVVAPDKIAEALQHATNYRRYGAWERS